jgi:hypothetical protein
MSTERDGKPAPEREISRGLTTDIAIGLGPTAAVVANHLLKKGDKPKPEPKK